MPLIRMSDATYRAIADYTQGPFISTGQRQEDGTWLVPIEQDALNGINALRVPGETEEDVILRCIRTNLGRRPS